VAWDETGKEKLMDFCENYRKEDRAFQQKRRAIGSRDLPQAKARTYFGLHLDHDWQRIVAKGGYWARIGGAMTAG